jgi:hypothetical protein
LRMGDLYQRLGPVPVGFSGQLRDTVFRNHVIGPVPAYGDQGALFKIGCNV